MKLNTDHLADRVIERLIPDRQEYVCRPFDQLKSLCQLDYILFGPIRMDRTPYMEVFSEWTGFPNVCYEVFEIESA